MRRFVISFYYLRFYLLKKISRLLWFGFTTGWIKFLQYKQTNNCHKGTKSEKWRI